MILHYSNTSPYVRKVLLLAHETGLSNEIRLQSVDGWSEPAQLTDGNPLSMVPTLLLDDGRALFDSRVICEYLDSLHGGPPMIPPAGEPRWEVLRLQALGDGMLDSALLIFLETQKRPQALRWDWWLAVKQRAISRALDHLELQVALFGPRVDLGSLAVAAALAYLDFRGAVGDWRGGRPQLAAWFARFARRASMLATRPEAASPKAGVDPGRA